MFGYDVPGLGPITWMRSYVFKYSGPMIIWLTKMAHRRASYIGHIAGWGVN